MSNPNPFVPKGSLLEQQSQRRSRLKIAVFCVVVLGTTGLMAMLIQGCKRDNGGSGDQSGDNSTNNPPPMTDTNLSSVDTTNSGMPGSVGNVGQLPPGVPGMPGAQPVGTQPLPPAVPPMAQPTIPQTQPTELPVAGGDYVIVAGDTLGKIAKKNGVSLKALEAANPGVDSRHLHVGKKLVLPAGGTAEATGGPAATDMTADAGTGTTYTVKTGDTLHKIAHKFGVSVKAIQEANNLTSTRINVGKKLKIPTKGEAAPAVPTTPDTGVPALPSVPPPALPASAPAPATNH